MSTYYTRGGWSQSVCDAIAGSQAGRLVVDFVVGWTVAEYSQAESKTALYNCLNCENGADISAWHPTAINSNGIVAFKSFADGVAATAARLKEYPALSAAIAASNAGPLGVPNGQPSSAVVADLRKWSGSSDIGGYIANIYSGMNRGGDQLYAVEGDTTANTSGPGSALTQPSQLPAGSTWDGTRIVKLGAGIILCLAAVALLIKSFSPSVGKVLK